MASSHEKDRKTRGYRDLLGVLHLTIAILLGVAFYAPSAWLGPFGHVLRVVCGGLFGTFSYALPPAFLLWSLFYFREKQTSVTRGRVVGVLIIVLILSAIFSLFTLAPDVFRQQVMSMDSPRTAGFRAIAVLWRDGSASFAETTHQGMSGGLLGGLVTQSLSRLAGRMGAGIILFSLLIAVVIYVFSLSPAYMFNTLYLHMKERLQTDDNDEYDEPDFESTETLEADNTTDESHPAASRTGLFARFKPHRRGMLFEANEPKHDEPSREALRADSETSSSSDDVSSDELSRRQIGRGTLFDRPTDSPPSAPVSKTGTPAPGLMQTSGKPFLFDETNRKEQPTRPLTSENQVAFVPEDDEEEPEQTPDALISPPATVRRPVIARADVGSIQREASIGREHWEDRTEKNKSETALKHKKRHRAEQISLLSDYQAPPLTLLREDKGLKKTRKEIEEIHALGEKLVDTLDSFGVEADIVNYTTGPTITRYELAPGPGVKVSRIVNLSDDIALSLAAVGVRIEAPIPGKSAIGIEIPNRKTSPVMLRGLLEDPVFQRAQNPMLAVLGRDAGGAGIFCDLSRMPHLLIAGATGSGKSVCINTILISLLFRASPQALRMLMIDPKIVELNVYNGIPHLLQPVVTDPEKAYGVLNWAVNEMERRYLAFAAEKVRDIDAYNEHVKREYKHFEGDEDEKPELLPYILIVIDELADLMATTSNQVETAISRLMAKARAAGIHVIIATQRPSVDVITGVIKANIPSRIAFAVASQVDSRTILDAGGAEKLLGKGDMLYYPQSAAKAIRGQGAFVSDQEVEQVLQYIKDYYPEDYDESVAEALENPDGTEGVSAVTGEEEDELLFDALRCVVETGQASVSLLQRKLMVGYPRAARLIDRLHELGYIGPHEGSKARKLLITDEQFTQLEQELEEPRDDL